MDDEKKTFVCFLLFLGGNRELESLHSGLLSDIHADGLDASMIDDEDVFLRSDLFSDQSRLDIKRKRDADVLRERRALREGVARLHEIERRLHLLYTQSSRVCFRSLSRFFPRFIYLFIVCLFLVLPTIESKVS